MVGAFEETVHRILAQLFHGLRNEGHFSGDYLDTNIFAVLLYGHDTGRPICYIYMKFSGGSGLVFMVSVEPPCKI